MLSRHHFKVCHLHFIYVKSLLLFPLYVVELACWRYGKTIFLSCEAQRGLHYTNKLQSLS